MIHVGDIIWAVELLPRRVGDKPCKKCTDGSHHVLAKDGELLELECPACHGTGIIPLIIGRPEVCAFRVKQINRTTYSVKYLHQMVGTGEFCEDLMPHPPLNQLKVYETEKEAEIELVMVISRELMNL